MSESPDDKKSRNKGNSDLSDIVQWGSPSGTNLPPPPQPELSVETPLEIPPPPMDLSINLPPPPPQNNLDIPPPPGLDSVPPPPGIDSIPPPPSLNENIQVETPEMEIPPPPALESVDLLDSLPPPPAPEPESMPFAIPKELNETMEEVIEVTDVEDSDYRELWKRTSDKPLQQVYGHIDRIGSGEVGSLLDRYADRFGSELDREIIVLRQQERQQKMQELHQVPIVELIEEDDIEENEEVVDEPLSEDIADELEDELDEIEDQILEIEKSFNKAKKKKKKADVKKFGDELNSLFERRDAINAILDGEEDHEALEHTEVAKTLEEDLFEKFVGVVDELLGKLPENNLNSFLESKDFDIYKNIASEPESASQKERETFFKLVNEKLAELPEEAINEFIASENWSLYEEMGEMYN
ncbi:MAG: Uncharacterised protein [Methanobacteriota archaeon]|nr:MAG: Uncharacterised protein [Euryarchaeota archaeon]